MKWLVLLGLICGTIWADEPLILSSPLVLKENNIVLDGVNRHYKLADNSNCPMIIVGDADNIEPKFLVKNVTIRNYILDGNKSKQSSEFFTHVIKTDDFIRNNIIDIRGASQILIENCIIFGARSGGICIEKNSRNVVIRNCIIMDNEFDGIAGYLSEGCVMENNTIINNKAAGFSFDISFNSCVIRNNKVINNNIGIFVRDSGRMKIIQNTFKNKEWDLYFHRTEFDPNTYPYEIIFDSNITFRKFVQVK